MVEGTVLPSLPSLPFLVHARDAVSICRCTGMEPLVAMAFPGVFMFANLSDVRFANFAGARRVNNFRSGEGLDPERRVRCWGR